MDIKLQKEKEKKLKRLVGHVHVPKWKSVRSLKEKPEEPTMAGTFIILKALYAQVRRYGQP